jgi:uncharacterized repeat protein (TIGR01451 family)
MAGGLIAMPIAVLSGHSAPVPSATATATATATASAGRPAATATASAARPAATATATGRRPAVPGLSISVTDGRTAVVPGDRLTYLVSIKDIGTLGAPHLKITQTLPAGLNFVSASARGVAADGKVTWLTGLAPGGSQTFTLVTQLTRAPARQLRLAAVACAADQGSASPIVCAAHLDRLPAVAASPAASASGSLGGARTVYLGAGLAVLVVAAFIVLVARRAGRHRLPG